MKKKAKGKTVADKKAVGVPKKYENVEVKPGKQKLGNSNAHKTLRGYRK